MAETTEQYRARMNQLKTSIENEPLIKEMRSDIAEGISKTGNRQADIEVRQDTLEDDFVAVQQDASSASPSGAEVAVARGSYPTLDGRLSAKEQQVTAQLAQTNKRTGENNVHINAFGSDESAINQAIDFSKNFAYPTLILDYEIEITNTIFIPPNTSLIMKAPLVYKGVHDKPCLVIGDKSLSTLKVKLDLRVWNKVQSLWLNEENVGIRLININHSDINILEASNFTVGVELRSTTSIAWNKFKINRISNNYKGIKFYGTDELSTERAQGWINANHFNSGIIHVGSVIPTDFGSDPIGIHMSSGKSDPYYNNTNTFENIDFEGKMVIAKVDYGSLNIFDKLRSEVTVKLAEINNNSEDNRFINAYENNMNTLEITDDSMLKRNYINEKNFLIFDSGLISDKFSMYGKSSFGGLDTYQVLSYSVKPYSDYSYGLKYSNQHYPTTSNTVKSLAGSTLITKFFKMNKTSKIRFVPNFIKGKECRIVVTCYDKNNVVLTDTTIFSAKFWVFNAQMKSFVTPGKQLQDALMYIDSSLVDHIGISLWTDIDSEIIGFKLYSLDNPTMVPFNPIENEQFYAIDKPTTHKKNINYIFNANITTLSNSIGSYVVKGWLWNGSLWLDDKLYI